MKSMMRIHSDLDALRLKDAEILALKTFLRGETVIPKVTPIEGINYDFLLLRNNRIYLFKFMETNNDIFSILGDEILEVIEEEREDVENGLRYLFGDRYQKNMIEIFYFFPYIDFKNDYPSFVERLSKSNIIDTSLWKKLINLDISIDFILKGEAKKFDNISYYLFRLCPEYFVVGSDIRLNMCIKDEIKLQGKRVFLKEFKLIADIASIKYGDTLVVGPSCTGKTSTMISKAMKLARVYPHHNFLIITHSKELRNYIRDYFRFVDPEIKNVEIQSISSFVFNLAKRYNLIIDHDTLKKDYDKIFTNLVKQARNVISDKRSFKGIFVDELEFFSEENIEFIKEFLYETKYIFTANYCKALNINPKFDIFKEDISEKLDFDYVEEYNRNYRQSKEIAEFVNEYVKNANGKIMALKDFEELKYFCESKPTKRKSKGLSIIRVSDLDDQMSSILWEVNHYINDVGLKPEDIMVLYPYNRKKLKNGKTIYFQYMLRKELEDLNIPYIIASDEITSFTERQGITISNIFSARSVEYKAVIVCELEMLFNQKVEKTDSAYMINDFLTEVNKVYLAITRAKSYLSIITSNNEESSEIIRLLVDLPDESKITVERHVEKNNIRRESTQTQ